ncbi:hypothetical protein F4777DRAFT_474030 [Nemania sp. FL0916]|nr:hypothetical protein F4777DRAFT_474030 [Nemania sp. FL0916]
MRLPRGRHLTPSMVLLLVLGVPTLRRAPSSGSSYPEERKKSKCHHDRTLVHHKVPQIYPPSPRYLHVSNILLAFCYCCLALVSGQYPLYSRFHNAGIGHWRFSLFVLEFLSSCFRNGGRRGGSLSSNCRKDAKSLHHVVIYVKRTCNLIRMHG